MAANKGDAVKLSLGYSDFLCSSNNKIWLFSRHGLQFALLHSTDQLLHVQVFTSTGSQLGFLSFIYGKCTRSARQDLWDSLSVISQSIGSQPWAIGGDFNVIASLEEYSGRSTPDVAAIEDFRQCIDACHLMDIPVTGGLYTWTGMRSTGRVWKRLDRILVSSDWLSTFPTSHAQLLPRTTSDHSPVLFSVEPASPFLAKPFRFQNFWLSRPDFIDVVANSWSEPMSQYGMLRFGLKLKRLRASLRSWNRVHVGNIFANLQAAERVVSEKEQLFDASGSSEDLQALNLAQAHYLKSLADEEQFWKQKARTKWLQEGDRNTSFFHASVLERRNQLRLTRIKNDTGQWLEDADAIKQHATFFFQALFTDNAIPDEDSVTKLLDSVPQLVSDSSNQTLLSPVTLAEVKTAVYGLDPDSSPGSDGFSGKFYRHCWDVISADLLLAVQEFFIGVPVPRIISNALLVLLPKKLSPSTFADYRPISLCNFVNKVCTRIICDRLRPLLPDIISEEQSAFLRGRDISDNILLAQEMMAHLNRGTRGHNMMLKLDMMKAFDRVSWVFLRRLLLKMGFHFHFVDVIMNNLSSGWFSVLINGTPASLFQSTRGLKQGDPLSPLLFILLTEALSRGIKALIQHGSFAPFALPRGSPIVSHLCFADDLIVFTKGNRATLRHLLDFFRLYETATGQAINFSKSSFVISNRCRLSQVRVLEHFTGISCTTLPMTYLGCPLFNGRKKVVYFAPLIQKLQNRLAGWKSRFLSSGGRLILIRHVLQAMPIHLLATMDPPKGVLRQLESLFSKFFWSSSDGQSRRIWRSWSGISYPTLENGIGVRKLEDVLSAFTCKLWWKLKQNIGIWAAFVNRISWQKSRFHSRLQQVQAFADVHMRTIVVDGSSNFWTSNWLGTGSLRVDTFGLTHPTLTLAVAFSGGSWQQRYFCQDVSHSELQQILSHSLDFLSAADFVVWKSTPSGNFSTSSAYTTLRATQTVKPYMVYIWSKHVPLKVSIFFWRLLNGWLPFDDVLQRMGFAIVSKCPHCCHSDSISHAFVRCPVSLTLWRFVSDRFHFLLPLNAGFWSIMHACWDNISAFSPLIRLLPAAVCWTVWKLRTHALYGDPIRLPSIPLLMETLLQFTQLHPLKVASTSSPLYRSLGLRTLCRRRTAKMVTWDLPSTYKLNVDGSLTSSGAGAGFVLRDSSGNMVGAESIFLGLPHATVLYAEATALWKGLQYCGFLGLSDFVVETDSKLLSLYLTGHTPWPWDLYHILFQSNSLLLDLKASLHHIYREANMVADFLATAATATQRSSSYTMSTLPPRGRGLVILDQQQCPNFRTISSVLV